MQLTPGTPIGPYEVLALLGRGGIGEVYRARDSRLDRHVAIKLLTSEAVSDQEHLRRFTAEAKAVSSLNHPNILTLHEIGESDFGPYIVTELVEGESIRLKLRSGPMSLQEVFDVALQVTSGLAKAHQAAIVHRDIKPDNLMRNHDGIVKILDFGLAKLMPSQEFQLESKQQNVTATGIIVGTPAYLSPEQLHGEEVDGRSDVFSLGVVLYEMLVGSNPFLRNTIGATLQAILNETPKPLHLLRPGVPDALVDILEKCLAKSRDERYDDAAAVRSALQRIDAPVGSGRRTTDRERT